MAWRVTYWRGTYSLRVRMIEEATQDEIASLLQKLAANQLELEYLRASGDDPDRPQTPDIRSNRSGTMLWTTGKDFHYTAEWFGGDNSDRRKR
jgi:hypothetical protein